MVVFKLQKDVSEISKFKNIWIGAIKDEEKWSWTDNTIFDFKNWGFMQPDSCCGTNVSCAVINLMWGPGQWFDVSCGAPHGFVCKYDPLSMTVNWFPHTVDAPLMRLICSFCNRQCTSSARNKTLRIVKIEPKVLMFVQKRSIVTASTSFLICNF